MDEIKRVRLRGDAMAGGERAREAFKRLWEEYYSRLFAFARSYRGLPASEREDAVADALIAAFGAITAYDAQRPLAPWVYRIAANRFSDAARLGSRVSSVAVGPSDGDREDGRGAFDPAALGDHEAEFVDRDMAERCRAAIAALPEGDRRIAMLRFYEGMSAVDIGRALGMPAGTVRWRVHAIRVGVKAAVGEDSP